MMTRIVFLLACAAALAALPGECSADPRGFAMGGTDAATARGADAVLWNPALLGLPDAPRMSVRLFQAGARADNNSFDLDQYRRLNGADWGDAEKSEILGSVPTAGLRLRANAGGGAGLSFGRFGVYADGIGAGDGSFARDGVDFALYGNELDRAYVLDGSGGKAFAAARVLFGVALPLRRGPGGASALGVQVAVERGIRWEDASTLQATFQAGTDTAEALGDFRLREGTRGTGYSVGLGYARRTPTGVVCLGPATRGGCGAKCVAAGMPCRGCYGRPLNVRDQGAKMASALASVIDSTDPAEIDRIVASIPDPVGTFYRFSLPDSMLRRTQS